MNKNELEKRIDELGRKLDLLEGNIESWQRLIGENRFRYIVAKAEGNTRYVETLEAEFEDYSKKALNEWNEYQKTYEEYNELVNKFAEFEE